MNNCSNCGSTMNAGIKFCTKCGSKMSSDEVASVAGNSNVTMDNFKRQSSNYFAWVKQTVLDPSKVSTGNKYFGLISFLIHALLVTFAVYRVENGILTPIAKGLSSSQSSLGDLGRKADIATGGQLFFKLFFISIIFYAIFLGIGFLAKKFLVNKQTNFFDYVNKLATYSNALMAVELLLALAMLIFMPADISTGSISGFTKAMEIMFLLFIVIGACWDVAYVATFVIEKAQMKWNKIYVAMLSLVASNLAVWFMINHIISTLQSKFSSILTEVFKQLMGGLF